MPTADVKIDVGPLRKLVKTIDKAGDSAAAQPMGAMFTQWGARYLTFTRRRFKKLSGGAGEWKGLKTATARRRKSARRSRRKHKTRRHRILVDTRTMFNALSIGMPGNLNKLIRTPAGVRVGFSNAPHNNDSLTIRDLVIIHDSGLGNMPKRVILAEPDSSTKRGMMSDASRAVQKIMKNVETQSITGELL